MCSIKRQALDKLGADTLSRIQKIAPMLLTTLEARSGQSLSTGNAQFNGLFPTDGVPYGHLFELTGPRSGGKTALAYFLLAKLPASVSAIYVDASNTFYPRAAAASGVAIHRLQVVMTATAHEAVSTAEHLLRSHSSLVVVCDFTDCRESLKIEQVHRLRINTIRSHGLVLVLTNADSMVIPPSMMSAQLTVTRCNDTAIIITVTKSRLMQAGKQATVYLQ